MKCAYNKRSGILFSAIVALFITVVQVQAGISVKVFSRDEALTETNMSKPRIYIQNTGDVALSGVKLYYYFTTEDDITPVLEKYYIPGFNVTLLTISAGNYKLEYSLNGTLNAGATVPGTDGVAVGLHYNSWSAWDKTNDFSNNQSAVFIENESIAVYYMGTRIYGNEPGGGSTPPQVPPDADVRLNSFALYSTHQTTIKDRSVFSGGGALGSNTLVEIKNAVVIHGNIVSGGNAVIWNNIHIDGDITLGGTLTQQGTGNTFGSLDEGVNVATLVLPDYAVTTTSNNITVNQSATVPLPAGIYGDLNVLQNGILKLYPGDYTFKKFYIENGGKVIFMIDNYLDQLDIHSSGEFDIQDGAELIFDSLSYAPSARIYTRDQNVLRIGVNAKAAGIITAPFATVNVYTGARCDGAIYAKNINIEPDAIINSEMVSDDDDYDNDGVPTRLEINNCVRQTNPKNGNEYEAQAIPDKLAIDNTQKVIITYDLNRFYNAYSPDAKLIMICPPGALQDPTKPPVIQLSAEMPAGLPPLPGYVPVGMHFQIKCNQINDGEQIFVGIPMPGNSTTGNYDMAMHVPGDSSWTTFQYPYSFLSGLSDEDRNLLMDSTEVIAMVPYSNSATDDVGTLVAVWKNTGTTVAYFDDGTVFSSKIGSEIEVNMELSDISGLDPANPGKIIIDYTDQAHPSTVIPPVELGFTINGNVMTCVNAISTTNSGIRLNSVIVTTRSASGNDDTVLTRNTALEAAQSESFYIHASCKLSDIDKDKKLSFYKVATMAFESAQIAGDGLITKESNVFKYNYFLKDHLGSTRMVLNEDGEVQQALMYQPYGTVSNVDEMGATSTDPLRQKFTTKELDEEGVIPDDQRMALGMIITMPEDDYSGSYKIKLNTVPDPFEGPLYNEVNGSGDPTLQAFTSLSVNGPEYYEYIEIQISNSRTSESYTYRLDGINWTGESGYLKTYTLDGTLSEIVVAISTSDDLFIESRTALGNSRMNLSYFGARYLDSDLGIWLGTDPADQYWNAFSYCGGNPIMLVDPNGEYGWVAGLIGGAAIGGSIGFVGGGLSGGNGWDWGRAWAGFGIGTAAGAAIGFGTSEQFLNFVGGNGFLSNKEAYINSVRANAVAPSYISTMEGYNAGLGVRQSGMPQLNSFGTNRSYLGNFGQHNIFYMDELAVSANANSLSSAGLNLIARFEGYSSTVYNDVAGYATIGFGHLIKAGESYSAITRAQALELLRRDASIAERDVNNAINVPLTQNQFDALTSFTYNVGGRTFGRSSVVRAINAGDNSAAANHLLRYNRAGGKVVSGLTKRRIAEANLFLLGN